LTSKRLGLLLEVAPDAKEIAYLSAPAGAPIYNDLRAEQLMQDGHLDSKLLFSRLEMLAIWRQLSRLSQNKGQEQ
jgi:hypothetical protein